MYAMKKLFRIFKIQGQSGQKIAYAKRIPDTEKEKTKVYIPITFDFTAYFDDNELENNADDIPGENSTAEANPDFFCLNDEKCNVILYSSGIYDFECCTN
jgi:hypothetical protein